MVATTTAAEGVVAGGSLRALARIQRDLRESKQQIKTLKNENAKLIAVKQSVGDKAADGAPAAATGADDRSAVENTEPEPDPAAVKIGALKALVRLCGFLHLASLAEVIHHTSDFSLV